MQSQTSLRSLFVWAVLGFAAACSSTPEPEAAAAAQATAGAERPLAPLPTEPRAIIADGASTLVVADVVALRTSPHYAFVRRWLTQSSCAPASSSDVLDRTTQLVVVEWPARGAEPAAHLAVLRGTYRAPDAQVALQWAASLTGRVEGPVSERDAGRTHVHMQGPASSAVIGEQLLVLGDHASVDAALALAEGDARPKLFDGELVQKNGVLDALGTRAVVLVSKPRDAVVRRTGKALATFGLPKDLIAGTVVALASLDASGAAIEARVDKADAELAAHAADLLRARLGQIGLLARIAGLPPALDRAEISASGASLQARLTVSHDELAVVTGRLQELVDAGEATCATASATP